MEFVITMGAIGAIWALLVFIESLRGSHIKPTETQLDSSSFTVTNPDIVDDDIDSVRRRKQNNTSHKNRKKRKRKTYNPNG